MADFFRPEAKAALWRLRDVIIACGVGLLGFWMVVTGVGFVIWLGYAALLVAAGLFVTGVQRARFRQGSDGPGIVQITERRLAYFGPLDGGVMDITDITKLAFDPHGHPAPHWILTGPELREIAIPTTARGAEALFDTFSVLPGIRTEKLLKALSHPPDQRVVIWSRPRDLLQ